MESVKAANAENTRRPKRQTNRDGNKSVLITHPAMNCVICADENVKYAATGSCDHPICSLCSLRIRVKSLDTCCPLCKQAMDIVIVYPVKLTGLKPFASFGIWGIDSPAPGLDIDHRAGIVFADCKDHFREMDKIRSIVCPLKKCNLRFPSQDVLLKHLNTAHPGQNLCILCLKNRPLFISEHSLMTTGELKKHMSAPPGALTGAGGDKTAGHPLCLFCNEHFFDSQALYLHMKQEHQSCHLCPTSYQFRFYPTMDELRTHLHDEHFVCNLCEKASANGEEGPGVFGSSFRSHGEYSSHLQSFHGVRNASVSLGFRVGYNDNGDGNAGRHGGKQRHNTRTPRNQLQFLDLDMASADPNRNISSQHQHRNRQESGQARLSAANNSSELRGQNSTSASAVGPQIESAMAIEARRRQLFHLQTSAAIAATPLVPAHMRVAGRVVAGRFQRDSEDDVIQKAADEQALLASATHGTSQRRVPGGWTERSSNLSSMNMAFPALSSSATTAARPKQNEDDQPLKGPAAAPHPLSLISGIQREAAARRALEEEKKSVEAELEDRRSRRNEMMAGALGVGQYSSTASALAGDSGVSLDPTVLRKVLYPPTLLTWAKNNKVELQKLEKKMQDLIADKKSNSAQLKPMGPSSRNAVHGLSRYYSLNSYEYDPEPRRYVSLVKSADSSAPSVRLSAAIMAPILPPVSMLTAMCEPSLYITLANPTSGYLPTDAINDTRGRQKASEMSTNLSLGGHVTVGDVIGRVRAVIKAQLVERHPFSPPQSYRITGVKTAGASSVVLAFPDMIAAVRVLAMIETYKKSGVSAVCDITPGLLDSFYIDPAFDPELFVESAEHAAAPTESDKRSPSAVQLDSFDSESYRPVYSMPMPTSAAAVALKKAGSSPKNEAGATKTPEMNSFHVDESLAAEWAELFETEEVLKNSATEVSASVQSPPGGLPPPPGLSDAQSLLSPPPGLAPRHGTDESPSFFDESHGHLKEAGVPAPAPVAEYRHLTLLPRTVPMPPPPTLAGPPSESRH